MQWIFEVSHSLWVSWICRSSIIHKTNKSFNYRKLFLCDSIRFSTQLNEDSCQSIFFLWFCPPIPKSAQTVRKHISPWMRKQYLSLSTHKRMGELYIFCRQVLQQFSWCCRTCLRLHHSNRRTLPCQNFPNRWYAISDLTASVSTVLTTHCFTPLLTQWIMWWTNFLPASSAVLILIDSSKIEPERMDSPLVTLNEWASSW